MIFLRAILLLTFLWAPLSTQGMESVSYTRIVSLSPAITAMLGELEQSHRLVGVTRYCHIPSRFKTSVQIVGGAVDPEVESILGLKPDIILASSLLPENIEGRFRALGIPVQRFRQDRLQDILDQVTWLGEHTGSSELAETEVAAARGIMKQARVNIEDEERSTGLMIFSNSMELAAGGDTYAGEVMELAGIKNVTTALRLQWPTISHEWLLEQDPEWILVATQKPASESVRYQKYLLALWRGHDIYSQLTAVHSEQVITIPDSQLVVPSLQVFSVIEWLQEKIHINSAERKWKNAHP